MKCEICKAPKYYESHPGGNVTLNLDNNKEAEIQIVKFPWNICNACFDDLVRRIRQVFVEMEKG